MEELILPKLELKVEDAIHGYLTYRLTDGSIDPGGKNRKCMLASSLVCPFVFVDI